MPAWQRALGGSCCPPGCPWSTWWRPRCHVCVCPAGDKLFFDKRDGSNLDLLTVAETAPEAVPEDKDDINGVQHLSIEATATNQAFSQQAGPLPTCCIEISLPAVIMLAFRCLGTVHGCACWLQHQGCLSSDLAVSHARFKVACNT